MNLRRSISPLWTVIVRTNRRTNAHAEAKYRTSHSFSRFFNSSSSHTHTHTHTHTSYLSLFIHADWYRMIVPRLRNCRRPNRSIPLRPRGRRRTRVPDTWKSPRCRVSRTDRKPELQSTGRPLQRKWNREKEKKKIEREQRGQPDVEPGLWSGRLKFQWTADATTCANASSTARSSYLPFHRWKLG